MDRQVISWLMIFMDKGFRAVPLLERAVLVALVSELDSTDIYLDVPAFAERLKMDLTALETGIKAAAEAGWLAPLDWGPALTLRTALTIPEDAP